MMGERYSTTTFSTITIGDEENSSAATLLAIKADDAERCSTTTKLASKTNDGGTLFSHNHFSHQDH